MDLSTLRIRLGRTENLPVLPEVVGSVLRLIGSDTSSTDQIKRHLESDSAIVAKLMRVANAPMYCPGERTTTLGRAISVLGI